MSNLQSLTVKQPPRLVRSIRRYGRENLGIIIAFLVLVLFLSINPSTQSSFLTSKNAFNVLRQISTNLYLACGMTMVII